MWEALIYLKLLLQRLQHNFVVAEDSVNVSLCIRAVISLWSSMSLRFVRRVATAHSCALTHQ